jgi:hypothetical protein
MSNVTEQIAATPIAGAPIAATPIAGAPIANAPIANAPIAATPIAGAPIANAPIAAAPIANAPIAAAPIANAPIAATPIAGAGIIIYTTNAPGASKKNPLILVGNESKYLIEHVYDAETKTSSITMNGAPATVTNARLQKVEEGLSDVKKVFLKRARLLEKKIGKRVQFNTPVSSIKYRIKGEKVGIPKGGKNIVDTDLIDTIIRECNEEIGFNLNSKKLRNNAANSITINNYIIYLYKLGYNEYNKIKHKIQERKFEHYSELFNIRFKPLYKLLSKHHSIKLNFKTREALEQFKRRYNPSTSTTRKNTVVPTVEVSNTNKSTTRKNTVVPTVDVSNTNKSTTRKNTVLPDVEVGNNSKPNQKTRRRPRI